MTRDPLADFDQEIVDFLTSSGIDRAQIQLSTPAQREHGERSTNVAMRLARERRKPPTQIAADIVAGFEPQRYRFIKRVEPAGAGFINFYLNYTTFVPHVIDAVRDAAELYGRRPDTEPSSVVVEHTSVNPNKEWHVGHVRNAVLGDVVSRLLRLHGDDVQVQNYIDDTGLQAAQAVLGLTQFPEAERAGEKFDHYSGRIYVKMSAELASEKSLRERLAELQTITPSHEGITPDERDELESIEARLENIEHLKSAILQTMRSLEEGEYRPLIRHILDGQRQSASRLGIFYELLAWESDLVQSHLFEEAMKRLEESPRVTRPSEGRYAGTMVIQTAEAKEGKEPKYEVLIRSSGIPTYVAKDIAYHMWKFNMLPNRLCREQYAVQDNGEILWSTSLHGEELPQVRLDRLINVIAVNQSLAQATVKEALRVTGFTEEAEKLVHLAYGLVSTKEGAISGRKGTSVAADTILAEAIQVAYDRIQEKRSQDLSDAEMRATAEAVGVGALRYFMVQTNPTTDIVFDVANVVSYDGNTALYIQYALVRMFAILRRAVTDHGITDEEIACAGSELLQHEQERRLIFHLANYPGLVTDASRTLAVNLVAEYAFDLATIFSQFYRDCAVLGAEPDLRLARLRLVKTVRDVLINACGVLGVPVIERL